MENNCIISIVRMVRGFVFFIFEDMKISLTDENIEPPDRDEPMNACNAKRNHSTIIVEKIAFNEHSLYFYRFSNLRF